MAGLDSNRGAKRAREARRALDLDPVAPLACLLSVVEQQAALPVVVARLPKDVAGACFRSGDATVLWVNGVHGAPRQRFTLAHELGHTWCGHDGTLELDSLQTLSGSTTDPLEIQANAFAAEFLLPRGAVPGLFDHEPGLEEIVVLAAHYGVSALVAFFRLTGAGVVADERARRLRAEIDEGEHLAAYQRLGLEPLDDRLAGIAELPYTSPALGGSALAAALGGDVAVAAAAHAAGVAAQDLAPALEAISAPQP
ncbi:MAG TPA: ImmA/IrrE family metallo-endopeptidase [Solirubrobacteraceae bacterium]|nr:ImmA/IrrE family metallo-endopeptidase [Solirubrobacteraceae bacterium]